MTPPQLYAALPARPTTAIACHILCIYIVRCFERIALGLRKSNSALFISAQNQLSSAFVPLQSEQLQRHQVIVSRPCFREAEVLRCPALLLSFPFTSHKPPSLSVSD